MVVKVYDVSEDFGLDGIKLVWSDHEFPLVEDEILFRNPAALHPSQECPHGTGAVVGRWGHSCFFSLLSFSLGYISLLIQHWGGSVEGRSPGPA